jgi:hypothetical protein
MKTPRTTNVRQRFLTATATAVLVAALSGSALAAQMVTGLLDANENGQPRLSTEECSAKESIDATAQATLRNAAVKIGLKLFYRPDRQSEPVLAAGGSSVSELNVSTDDLPLQFQPPGWYQLRAINNRPDTTPEGGKPPVKVNLTLSCDGN